MRASTTQRREVYLVANGDLRLSANRTCWPEQRRMEGALIGALRREGWRVKRAHSVDRRKGHGFIDSQRMGIEVFRGIPKTARLIVAESVWQYSQHVLPGLSAHRGPILTVANWSGRWPGLVGLLNLNGSLTKMEVPYSSLWSEDFGGARFRAKLGEWLTEGRVGHDQSHVRDFDLMEIPSRELSVARGFARGFRERQALLGVFDEGCMGMHNAILPDELLAPLGVFKERLSQSTLYAAMQQVTAEEANSVYRWTVRKGLRYVLGTDERTELTERQVLDQCRMYVAAVRLASAFGCDAIGIQYQQGLKDLTPASDLVEGLLNNTDRPPVRDVETGEVLFPGSALPHFNEVDEGAALDGLITHRLWGVLGQPPENTLHDLRWSAPYRGPGLDPDEARDGGRNWDGRALPHRLNAEVWVLLISGAAPPSHFVGGYRGASSERQPPMYFRLGGGTLKGISKPGYIVWSRVFVAEGQLHADLGVGKAVGLPARETDRRWKETTPQWPILHAVFPGISRDQMMARHKSNHIQVVYARDRAAAHRACRIKAAVFQELGLRVALCGEVDLR